MIPPTYEVAQRTDGSWGVKRSNSETIFGTFETEGHAQAAVDGATWVQEGLGVRTVAPASDIAATPSPSSAATGLCTPWRYVPWHIAEGNSQVRSAEGWLVCETPGDEFARLIAAAPELLEALQALFDDYKALADSGDAGNWKLERLEVGKQALAAIAKAVGQ